MPEQKEFYFPSSTGKNQIYVRMWIPDAGTDIKATVQLSHGIAEGIDRYDDFAQFLARNGYVVVGNDHLGHAKSVQDPKDKGFFAEENGWAYVVADLKGIYNQVKELFPDLPHVLLGHSMGSFLARTYIIKYPNDFDACIISGTGNQPKLVVGTGFAVAQNLVNRLGPRGDGTTINNLSMGGYNKGLGPKNGPSAWLTRDKDVVTAYDANPDYGYVACCSVYRDMLGGIKLVTDKKNIAKVNKNMPILIFSGDQDPVGEKGKGPKRAYNAYKKAGVKDVTLTLYPGGRHEMLNEINKEQVYDDILKWIQSKVG